MKDGILFVLLFVIISLFSSCAKKRNDDMAHLVNEWRNKEINFPHDLYFTIYGKDTVQYPERLQYTIVSYVDSAGCLSCKLRLPMWSKFINQLDSAYSNKVSVLFFLHSKIDAELLFSLKENRFDYPICIDEEDKFNSLNHFPTDMSFQTFLLDEENKVLAMGNPILNPKIKELYMKIIGGKSTVQEMEKDIIQTKVYIDKTSFPLGNFDWHQEQIAIFNLKNVGNKPLVIEYVNTSCGCTLVDYSKEPVQPGKEIKLHTTYKAEHPEHFSKTITVYCNAETSPIKLTISGTAK